MHKSIEKFFSRFHRSALLTLVAGGVSSTAMAPTNFWPALFVGFSALYIALSFTSKKRQAFALGWLFGFGYFALSLSWIGNALLVDGNPYKWAWPLAVSGLPAGLAFFPALACLGASFFDLKRITGFTAFVALLGLSEFLRGVLFTGFPWNLYGYGWAGVLEIVQSVSIISTYGLSVLTILWGAALGFIALAPRSQRIAIAALCIVSFGACFGYGYLTLKSTEQSYHETTQMLLVQPNIEQSEKWDRNKVAMHFSKMLEMSRNKTHSDKVTYIVWPETAIRDWFIKDKGSLNAIRAMLKSYPQGAYLFTGLLRHDETSGTYHNSLGMIDADGRVSNIYDKHHLVPFGEYIPFQKWIPLAPIVQFTGFEEGDGLQSLDTPNGLKYSALICYEVLFPGRSTANGEDVDFIINITNDAWYGHSAGPYQHYTKAIFRAVETRTPLARVANTGFTGMIDPFGRSLSKTDLFEEKAILVKIPQK